MSEPIEPEVMSHNVRFSDNLNLMGSQLCVNCYPKQKYAIFMWAGMGLCSECFIPLRKAIDNPWGWSDGGKPPVGIKMRKPYKEVWGEEPVQDAEVV